MTAKKLEDVLRDLAAALEGADGLRGRDARLRAARQVLVRTMLATLGKELPGHLSVAAVIRLAVGVPDQIARRECAVLLVHAVAVPGLVPPASASDVCSLVEGALHKVLIRGAYPFSGSIEERYHVLERLHSTIGELMQPLEPTFPNWQGLYAG